ncbi:uncharacterized protein HMPREF1120_07261 [Exophiala dermatitidis NIH/UT8656]|uniref:Uncharacterized protein n=1 Tax=Exophiala dermatitidis (strain ATCC 34100 / CBS 525.76 / NIH/UT8656) TaxID=858893 RepID=H6C6C2_EXODN|nr:uncharacterized protein HMPREF1120_07261 [Exophiala dermatitidis NIH/UT8656]EHY59268.1 hypothetical protein HMPREF1120_07261 [Exophiala dermatitidis NIH/UT8656]
MMVCPGRYLSVVKRSSIGTSSSRVHRVSYNHQPLPVYILSHWPSTAFSRAVPLNVSRISGLPVYRTGSRK